MRSCSENDLLQSWLLLIPSDTQNVALGNPRTFHGGFVRWEISKMVDFPAMTIMMTILRVVVSLFGFV